MRFHGMKLHVVAIKRFQALLFPALIFASEASCHDLPIARQMLEKQSFEGFCLSETRLIQMQHGKHRFGTNTSFSSPIQKVGVFCPRLSLASMPWILQSAQRANLLNLFFHGLHEKMGIQFASKVRSLKGLLLHISVGLLPLSFSSVPTLDLHTDIAKLTNRDVTRIEQWMNRYPRRQFQFRSAADVAADFLASDGWAT